MVTMDWVKKCSYPSCAGLLGSITLELCATKQYSSVIHHMCQFEYKDERIKQCNLYMVLRCYIYDIDLITDHNLLSGVNKCANPSCAGLPSSIKFGSCVTTKFSRVIHHMCQVENNEEHVKHVNLLKAYR